VIAETSTMVLAWLQDGGRLVLVLGAALALGLVVHGILFALLGRVARHTPLGLDDLMVKHLRAPARLLIPVVLAGAALPLVGAPPPLAQHLVRIAGIGASAWLLIRLTRVAEDTILGRLALDARDNLRARAVETQLKVLRRIAIFAVVVLATGAALLSFDGMRQIGAGLLTSAGIAGIVVGFAAQKTLGNLLAGIQIAVTQPIRLDDVVIVEGEWGWIEEITLTYVVVRIWDLRRLVVPISYFIEKPFENWTRTSADLLGSVFLRLDYRVPFDALREQVRRLAEGSEHWDGKLWRLHVTDADDRSVQVRALVSAADSPSAWELRCELREGLIRWLAEHHPDALPRLRADLSPAQPGPADPSADTGRQAEA
jgi:hypothetical protein